MQVSSIESTVELTYEWLNQLVKFAKFRDSTQAYSVLRIVLHALRDRLPLEAAVNFAAQLPLLLIGVYYNGWQPNKIVRDQNIEEFIGSINYEERELDVNPKESVAKTFQFLQQKINPGTVEKMLSSLPEQVRNFLTQK